MQAHVDHNSLARLRERLPVQIHAAVLQVARDEYHGLRAVAVCERNTSIRSAAGSGGDAGHDLKGDAFVHERLDLFPAASEDKRIAALQTDDALAFTGEAHQQVIEVFLREDMRGARLARVNALGVKAHQVEHGLRHQAVIHNDIGLLHEAQCSEREQIRIARSGADKVDLAALHGEARVVDGPLQCLAGILIAPAEYQLGDRALQHAFPEAPSPRPPGRGASR